MKGCASGAMRRLLAVGLALLALLAFPAAPLLQAASAGDGLGVVLLHGRKAQPTRDSAIGQLADWLTNAGFIVALPEMPWSARRYLDADYEEAMREIDRAVRSLREMGAGRIVVGGHSLGANAAIGYGARRPGLAGIMALAPGHRPESGGSAWRRAKAMVESGRGESVARFGGERMKARIYLSWFAPDGPAVMPNNAPRLTAPLLWIVGKRDPIARRGPAYAFAKAPPHPKSRYLVVARGHYDTPVVAEDEIVAWLEGL